MYFDILYDCYNYHILSYIDYNHKITVIQDIILKL